MDESPVETLSDRAIAEETLRHLRKVDAMLTEFEPVIAQFRNPVSSYFAARRAQKTATA